MAKVRIAINKNFIDQLKSESGGLELNQITDDAFSLLRWAISEVKNGRVLLTSDKMGENPKVVRLISLGNVDEKIHEKSSGDNSASPGTASASQPDPDPDTGPVPQGPNLDYSGFENLRPNP